MHVVKATECADCGEPIPEARVKILEGKGGARRCVGCQDRHEKLEGTQRSLTPATRQRVEGALVVVSL